MAAASSVEAFGHQNLVHLTTVQQKTGWNNTDLPVPHPFVKPDGSPIVRSYRQFQLPDAIAFRVFRSRLQQRLGQPSAAMGRTDKHHDECGPMRHLGGCLPQKAHDPDRIFAIEAYENRIGGQPAFPFGFRQRLSVAQAAGECVGCGAQRFQPDLPKNRAITRLQQYDHSGWSGVRREGAR